MVFYVIFRYRLPLMPVLCLGAGLGGWLLWTKTIGAAVITPPQR